jgi:hypothetical protein
MSDEPRRKTRYRGERCTSKLTLNCAAGPAAVYFERRNLLGAKEKANGARCTGCPYDELAALQGPKHFVDGRWRDPEIFPKIGLGGRPSMKRLIAMDECQVLALLRRVTEAARARSDQVRPGIHIAGKPVLQARDKVCELALRRLVLGIVRRLFNQPAELARLLIGQFQAYDRSLAATGPENRVESPRWLDVGNQEVALLRGQLDEDFRTSSARRSLQVSSLLALSNDMRISCRRSSSRPHKSTRPLLGHWECGARTERRPASACRLHARVRQRRLGFRSAGATAESPRPLAH